MSPSAVLPRTKKVTIFINVSCELLLSAQSAHQQIFLDQPWFVPITSRCRTLNSKYTAYANRLWIDSKAWTLWNRVRSLAALTELKITFFRTILCRSLWGFISDDSIIAQRIIQNWHIQESLSFWFCCFDVIGAVAYNRACYMALFL